MNKKIINEWLSDIATPTGISYSGDKTISESMVEKIVDYVSNLEQALDEIEKYVIENSQYWDETGLRYWKDKKDEPHDILEIIKKAKGDVK